MRWHVLWSTLLGALSGGPTYYFSQDGGLALIVGAVVFVLYWLGTAAVLVIDGEL